ncbi:HEAT repeat domain-containing protein [Halapricum salinum]|uniref:HEAT repeat domain-containing protein n=1 Tax=Halapricum salinum TaxID=1457250 RepID=A0A4D6HB77_9EURY|nr:HEAT repeat domain-containing protein [Halapricum salinum]QCC50017.1 HEAT repeat domain-containing protein [Halapricum salinum]
MSNGDDEDAPAEETAAEETASGDEVALTDVEDFQSRLDDVDATLDDAETEADLDDVEATLDATAEALEAADLPEPDDDDEQPPAEAIEERIDGLRSDLEDARGPYLEDVIEIVESVAGTIRETRWTDDGAGEVEAAVTAFLEDVDEAIDADVGASGDAAELLDAVGDTLGGISLDPDGDSETIAALLSAATELDDAVEAAEAWDDLTVREQLTEEGFYDVLTSERRKDYPPEWSAVKLYEKQYQKTGDPEAVEMILLALEKLTSDFMEENCLDSLKRIGPEEAVDPVLQRASKRDKLAIDVLGKIGSEEALDTLVDFIDGDGDPALQQATLRSLGAIGSEEATQAVANRLDADNPDVRSAAARSLGRVGDTRAIEPLADILADDPEESVRASAAWALVQIGTESALETVSSHSDDSYLVEAEAEKVTRSA